MTPSHTFYLCKRLERRKQEVLESNLRARPHSVHLRAELHHCDGVTLDDTLSHQTASNRPIKPQNDTHVNCKALLCS